MSSQLQARHRCPQSWRMWRLVLVCRYQTVTQHHHKQLSHTTSNTSQATTKHTHATHHPTSIQYTTRHHHPRRQNTQHPRHQTMHPFAPDRVGNLDGGLLTLHTHQHQHAQYRTTICQNPHTTHDQPIYTTTRCIIALLCATFVAYMNCMHHITNIQYFILTGDVKAHATLW